MHPLKTLIVGLGNPGEKYQRTRHNAGFLFLDYLADKWSFPEFSMKTKLNSHVTQGVHENIEYIFAKPQTFMNKSGDAVGSLFAFYKIPLENMIIVHDELDIALGKMKIARDSRAAGHNGVQHIFDVFGTQKFTRLRLGISTKTPEGSLTCSVMGPQKFVLAKFSQEEQEQLTTVFAKAEEELFG
jgi:PTH1 family peptidyl-tRNA hydrolase